MRKTRIASVMLAAVFIGTFLLVGCSGGAVVFAPTAVPADASPVRYLHPSRAFSLDVPRRWALYEQNTTTLASASFSEPEVGASSVLAAAVRLNPTDAAADFSVILDRYQTQIRPDAESYIEGERVALSDGSWRLSGLRRTPGGERQIDTFIARSGDVVGVVEIVLPVPDDARALAQLQVIADSFVLDPEADLEATPLSTLTFAKESALTVLHVSAWTTPSGVFFITGEVANYGTTPAIGLPIEAALTTSDGLQVVGAVDTVMGYGVPPGGFAPFSLRFGAGQPSAAASYALTLGKAWTPTPEGALITAPTLRWTDEASFDTFDRLTIRGTVSNDGAVAVQQPRVIATVFDGAQNVIGAAWSALEDTALMPGETAPFEVSIAETGGPAENYIVVIQGTP